MPSWKQKSVLITGGSAGLGVAIARRFAAEGASVAIVGRDPSRLSSAAAQLNEPGRPPILALTADLTRQSQVQDALKEATEAHGGLDLLVNCAGRSCRGAIESTTAEQFQELLEINFLAAVRCTQAALPQLLARRGHVVFIGSLASKVASRYLGAYPASKFPLTAYAQQLRLELGPQGLHTLLVCPGPLRRDDAGQRYEAAADGLPSSAKQPGGGAKLRGIDPDDLAQRIARACERRQSELIVPASAKLLFAISQLWPGLGDRLLLCMTGG